MLEMKEAVTKSSARQMLAICVEFQAPAVKNMPVHWALTNTGKVLSCKENIHKFQNTETIKTFFEYDTVKV